MDANSHQQQQHQQQPAFTFVSFGPTGVPQTNQPPTMHGGFAQLQSMQPIYAQPAPPPPPHFVPLGPTTLPMQSAGFGPLMMAPHHNGNHHVSSMNGGGNNNAQQIHVFYHHIGGAGSGPVSGSTPPPTMAPQYAFPQQQPQGLLPVPPQHLPLFHQMMNNGSGGAPQTLPRGGHNNFGGGPQTLPTRKANHHQQPHQQHQQHQGQQLSVSHQHSSNNNNLQHQTLTPNNTTTNTSASAATSVSNPPNTTNANPSSNLIINFIPRQVSLKEFTALFAQFGPIKLSRIVTDDNGQSREFGFILYERFEDALRAMREMQGYRIGGKTLRVGFAGTPPRNFKPSTSWDTWTTEVRGGNNGVRKPSANGGDASSGNNATAEPLTAAQQQQQGLMEFSDQGALGREGDVCCTSTTIETQPQPSEEANNVIPNEEPVGENLGP